MTTAMVKRDERNVGLAYLMWLPCLVGLHGMHRFYAGRWVSGLVWLLTGGICGLGSVVDLFFIPRMVHDHNEGRSVW